ncbi:hypothetical protein F2P81_021647 [Scophthalmus maximus]|uniref:Uncharacterized protein n=1 Tax=Scophthalmus maximus TaxID=52904 RepID=A0A6A4S5V5_SCOMX|nr:hypothetical protein F2P81_021647 [Scophthalmus maximus]
MLYAAALTNGCRVNAAPVPIIQPERRTRLCASSEREEIFTEDNRLNVPNQERPFGFRSSTVTKTENGFHRIQQELARVCLLFSRAHCVIRCCVCDSDPLQSKREHNTRHHDNNNNNNNNNTITDVTRVNLIRS